MQFLRWWTCTPAPMGPIGTPPPTGSGRPLRGPLERRQLRGGSHRSTVRKPLSSILSKLPRNAWTRLLTNRYVLGLVDRVHMIVVICHANVHVSDAGHGRQYIQRPTQLVIGQVPEMWGNVRMSLGSTLVNTQWHTYMKKMLAKLAKLVGMGPFNCLYDRSLHEKVESHS